MTGTLFSTRQNKSPSSSDYHPHSSHPCLRQQPPPPLSPLSLLSQSSTPPTSQSRTTANEMSDRPTLPGIASILAFAGQHRPAPSAPSPSHSHPHSARLQSSDPVAHALPAFVPIPPFQPITSYPSSAPYFDSNLTSSRPYEHGHRRRSSSVTIVQVDPPFSNRSPAPRSIHLQHSVSSLTRPQASGNPRSACPESSRTQISSPSSSVPPTRSFRDLCHPSDRPVGKEPYPTSTADRQSSSFQLGSSTAPSQNQNHNHHHHHHHHHHHSGRHIPDDVLQRRHSERIPGARSHLGHHHTVPAGRITPPEQQSCSSERSRHHSLATLPISPTPGTDRTVRHIRRPSNASLSSSSSISGPVSVSSDFGASSLSIGSQSNLKGPAHLAPSTLSINTTLSSACQVQSSSSRSLQTKRSWTTEDEQALSSRSTTIEDHRAYPEHNPRRGSDDSPSHHRPTSNQPYHSPPPLHPHHHHHQQQQSASPEMNSSSGPGGPIINNSNYTLPSSLGPQHHRYQCMEPGCGKTFSRPSSLKIHSYSHTGQKPFKCMRCDRAFSVQSNLKRHQKVHEKRGLGGAGRNLSNLSSGGPGMMMVYNDRQSSGRSIEEDSAEEDHGLFDRMEE
ncbi:hypothetical protein MJO28_017184 [Puccinia striiformis f. sp. tritici]|nr:hypothetical protein MJO28_017184 [Puccinia striiformis f. sp. tritici]